MYDYHRWAASENMYLAGAHYTLRHSTTSPYFSDEFGIFMDGVGAGSTSNANIGSLLSLG